MTTVLIPTTYAASTSVYTCCLCTTGDEHRMVLTVPTHSRAFLCLGCGHTVCSAHQELACGLCLSCCWEQHGSHPMSAQPEVKPLATMEEAWAESDRLWAEGSRMRAGRDQVVILTAQALYGMDVEIDWSTQTVVGHGPGGATAGPH